MAILDDEALGGRQYTAAGEVVDLLHLTRLHVSLVLCDRHCRISVTLEQNDRRSSLNTLTGQVNGSGTSVNIGGQRLALEGNQVQY